jgi:hypothetical protein
LFRKRNFLRILQAPVALTVVAPATAAIAVTAVSFITASTAATVSATAVAPTASVSATATGAIFGFADACGTASAIGSIEIFDGFFTDFTGRKGYKGKSARTSCVAVEWHVKIYDWLVFS